MFKIKSKFMCIVAFARRVGFAYNSRRLPPPRSQAATPGIAIPAMEFFQELKKRGMMVYQDGTPVC